MARTPALASASRIRIEDEVWEEAFSTRVAPRRVRPVERRAAPAGAMQVRETPVRETPVRETPVRATPVRETPVRATPPSRDRPSERPASDGPRLRVVETAGTGSWSDHPESSGSPYGGPEEGGALPLDGRRTIRIQGRGADPFRSLPSHRLRATTSPLPGRLGTNPDRLAMWATLLGFVLVLVAILSSHF